MTVTLFSKGTLFFLCICLVTSAGLIDYGHGNRGTEPNNVYSGSNNLAKGNYNTFNGNNNFGQGKYNNINGNLNIADGIGNKIIG